MLPIGPKAEGLVWTVFGRGWPVIELQQIGKVYHASDGDNRALEDVNLTIRDGDIFGIIGESGAGKSTLVRLLNLLERPTEGRIIVDDTDITDFTGRQLRELRANIGMIFQNISLFQQRTVLQNVMFPLEVRREPKTQNAERAHELLRLVSLDDKAMRYPGELSGGQQQRVAIARALANQPRYMLCDEATSALDSRTTVQVLDLLGRINAELGVTMVVITHSLAVARRICNRIAVIDAGRIVEEGRTADVFANPQSKMARELLDWGFETLEEPAGAPRQTEGEEAIRG
ncbi:MAG TPA: ABC transporter [Eggerthellaceae bacterium]|nr:ABC transporter [Eggerthellaceae bacterium]